MRLKKIIRFVLKSLVAFVGFLILLLIFINLPFSHRFVTRQVNQILIKADVPIHLGSIEKIRLRSARIEGLTITGPLKDTIIYVGKVETGIHLLALTRSKVVLQDVEVSHASVSLITNNKTKRINIAEAFTPIPKTEAEKAAKEKAPWEISINKGNLSEVKFLMSDSINGLHIFQEVENAKLKKISIKILDRDIRAHTLEVREANGSIRLSPQSQREKKKGGAPWTFGLENLSMEQLDFTFDHLRDSLFLNVSLEEGKIRDNQMDVISRLLDVDKISLEKANLTILAGDGSTKPAPLENETYPAKKDEQGSFPWDIRTDKIDLKDIAFRTGAYCYPMPDSSLALAGLTGLYMNLRDVKLSEENTGVKINKLQFNMDNGFSLVKTEGALKSDSGSTTLKFALETGNGHLKIEGEAEEAFFDLISDPANAEKARLDILSGKISLMDIASFYSSLQEIPIYDLLATSPVVIDGQLQLDRSVLTVPGITLSQDENFIMKLDGTSEDLFHPKIAAVDIGLGITNVNMEWMKVLFAAWGFETDIPENSDLTLKGRLSNSVESPEIQLAIVSNLGKIDAAYKFDTSRDSFYLNTTFEDIMLGEILSNPSMGLFTGYAEINGTGITPVIQLETWFKVRVDSFRFKDYTYRQVHMAGLLQPDALSFNFQSNDSAFLSNLDVDLNREDSIVRGSATGTLLVQLNELHFYLDTLAVESGITATLFKEKNALEADLHLNDIFLTIPGDTFELNQLGALFKTDSNHTSLIAEADFFDLDIELEKHINKLGTLGEDYSEYFQSFIDTSHEKTSERVANLPEVHATSHITDHKILDLVFQDTGFQMATLDLTLLNEPLEHKVNYKIKGNGIDYKSVKLGNINIAVTDTAGIMRLVASADSTSLLSGPESSFFLTGWFSRWRSETGITVLGEDDEVIYGAELESFVERNFLFLKIPSREIILNRKEWKLNSPDILKVDLASYTVLPEIKMYADSSYLHIGSTEENGFRHYNMDINQVRFASILWEDLLDDLPEGIISGSLNYITDGEYEKELTTDLNISNASYSGLGFKNIQIDGSLAISDSSNYSADLFARFDSSIIEFTSKKVADHQRTIKTDFKQIPLGLIQPLTMDYLSDLGGNISGNFDVLTRENSERFTGEVLFHGAEIKVTPLNSRFRIPNQSIQFEDDRMVFNEFRVLDSLNKPLMVDGYIDFRNHQIITDLNISSSTLQLMNTTEKDNESFHGTVFVDSDINFKGPVTNPTIDANIHLSRGTKLFFSYSDDVDLSASADIVTFVTLIEEEEPIEISPVSRYSNFDLSSVETIFKIDPNTLINFKLAKQIFNIELEIKGGGSLNYILLNQNQATLSGKYEMQSGSAELNIVGWPNKYFTVTRGGYVNWDGIINNPELKFQALSKVASSYTNPVDGQLRHVDFNVVLQLSGKLSDLDILFTINTEDQYLMSIINTLSPDEQMKQALTLLLFEIVDLPGVSTSTDYMTQQVNQILSSQLNRLTKSAIKGVDISFGIDSHSSQNEGGGETSSTSLSYEVSKSLLNDRANIEVSGRLQNPNETPGAQDQALNNVSFEYALDSARTKYLKVYNEQTYEDVFEGQVTKTGIGFTYRKPYRTFGEIWKRNKNKKSKNSNEEEDEN